VLDDVIRQWRRLLGQHMRTTLVSNANALFAPVLGLLLCVPNYVRGELLLGEVTQAAAAFFVVQSAGNWLVDNFPRLAECLSSAARVGSLLIAMDAQSEASQAPATGEIGTPVDAGVASP
jgi:putative ATP-binding cassette transporter